MPAANFSGSGYERNQNGTSGLTTAWAQPSGLSLAPGGGALFVAGARGTGAWLHGWLAGACPASARLCPALLRLHGLAHLTASQPTNAPLAPHTTSTPQTKQTRSPARCGAWT